MNQTDLDDDNDVVVIEQRDKRGVIYISVAAILGLALGGLIGSSLTASKWEKTYHSLEKQYQQTQNAKAEEAANIEQGKLDAQEAYEQQLAEALEEQEQVHQKALTDIEVELSQLKEQNAALESQVVQQKADLQKVSKKNDKLNRQSDMQSTMLERSRELFQKELKIKQEVEKLQKEREGLLPKLADMKKECDVYLAGKSWDVTSDACDKQDEVNSRMSEIDQMLRVHQLDLDQIKSLSEEMGL